MSLLMNSQEYFHSIQNSPSANLVYQHMIRIMIHSEFLMPYSFLLSFLLQELVYLLPASMLAGQQEHLFPEGELFHDQLPLIGLGVYHIT